MMRRLWSNPRRLQEAGERARQTHSAWLTRVLVTDQHKHAPRIPTRPVRDGGFGTMMSSPHGRRWAFRWWRSAFSRVDELER
jgi:hypothetical protein